MSRDGGTKDSEYRKYPHMGGDTRSKLDKRRWWRRQRSAARSAASGVKALKADELPRNRGKWEKW